MTRLIASEFDLIYGVMHSVVPRSRDTVSSVAPTVTGTLRCFERTYGRSTV